MKINIEIDTKLLTRAKQITNVKSTKAAIENALVLLIEDES